MNKFKLWIRYYFINGKGIITGISGEKTLFFNTLSEVDKVLTDKVYNPIFITGIRAGHHVLEYEIWHNITDDPIQTPPSTAPPPKRSSLGNLIEDELNRLHKSRLRRDDRSLAECLDDETWGKDE